MAAWWKKQIRAAWKKADPYGQLPRPEHGMDLLRAKAYLALLLGQPLEVPPAGLLPAEVPQPGDGTASPGDPGRGGPGSDPARGDPARGEPGTGSATPGSAGPGELGTGPGGMAGPDSVVGPGSEGLPAGLRRPDPVAGLPPMAGLISLTIPLSTFLGVSDRPGEAAGYGPLHADTARLIACALAGHRATRWQVILTGPDGRALAAGTARGNPAAAVAVVAVAVVAVAAGGRCR